MALLNNLKNSKMIQGKDVFLSDVDAGGKNESPKVLRLIHEWKHGDIWWGSDYIPFLWANVGGRVCIKPAGYHRPKREFEEVFGFQPGQDGKNYDYDKLCWMDPKVDGHKVIPENYLSGSQLQEETTQMPQEDLPTQTPPLPKDFGAQITV